MTDSPGLSVGSRAPDVTAPLVDPDGTVSEASLSTLYAERPVLLVFYTNDFTPDCIEEWCSFRDYDWFTTGETVRIVGVSKSRVSTHRRFIDHLSLSFPLYADTDLVIADAYDVVYRVFKLVKRAHRSCFLVDTDGIIRYRWLADHPIDPTRETPPVDEIHEAIVHELGEPDPKTFGFG
ncbi:MAG: redoxin domain-containing protein [Euryarchaeota archaeon]|jgi:peroxiredoxin|nr:redoxin domain-containing protein [Euryarchaeota archaeon]